MAIREILTVDTQDKLIRRLAAEDPDRIGLIFEGQEYTYAEINAWANRAANAFLELGISKGDRIAWLARNVGEFWFALLGAMKIGAVLTPVNWRLAPPEIAAIIADAHAKILIAEDMFLAPLQAAGADLPERIFSVDGENGFNAFMADRPADEPRHAPADDDIVVQLYTSGTTGLPKGVLLSHSAYAACGEAGAQMRLIAPQTDDEIALHALPHFHVAGVNFGLMAMARRMPIVQHRVFDPAAIVEAAQDGKPINSFFVPAMIMMVLQAAQQAGKPVDQFVSVSYGAAPMPEPLLDAAMAAMPKARFTQFYGATETTGGLTCLVHDDHAPGRPHRRSAGKPYPGTEVRIVNPETREDVGPGETGEILTRSGFLLTGYWKRPDATDEVLQDGWYATGDAGYYDENGFIYVVDRIKDMIISGGENIYPAELENWLARHPEVADCAVIGVPDEKWGEVVKACIVRKPSAALCENGVVEHLSGNVARFKLPRYVEFMDMLPRNPSGKILKTELRRAHQAA